MAKTSITAVYQAGEHERYACTVKVGNGYPDALNEARTQAVRGVSEMLAMAIQLLKQDDG